MSDDFEADLAARLAAADLGWAALHGDQTANPDYIRFLARQIAAFVPITPPAASTPDGHERELLEEIDNRDRAEDIADQLASAIAKLTGATIGEHSNTNDPWANALEASEAAASTPDTELRERYARAIARAMWGAAANRDNPMPIDWAAADAVMAERDTEVERLTGELAERTRERDLAVAHDRQPYPTAWAYEQACAALHRKEAELAALRAGRDLALWLHAEQAWRYNVVLRDCAEAQTAEDVAIEEGRGYLTRSRELASQLAALRAQQQDMVRLPADARGEIERLLTANAGKPAGGVAHKVMLLLTDDWSASPASTEGWREGQDAAAERQRE